MRMLLGAGGVGTALARIAAPLLMLLRFPNALVAGDPCPPRGMAPRNKAWMSQPCRWSCVNGTSTPYDLVLAVPE